MICLFIRPLGSYLGSLKSRFVLYNMLSTFYLCWICLLGYTPKTIFSMIFFRSYDDGGGSVCLVIRTGTIGSGAILLTWRDPHASRSSSVRLALKTERGGSSPKKISKSIQGKQNCPPQGTWGPAAGTEEHPALTSSLPSRTQLRWYSQVKFPPEKNRSWMLRQPQSPAFGQWMRGCKMAQVTLLHATVVN